MNLFDKLVDEALANRQELAPLRMVVEKELLHHDILRVLSRAGLLAQLTFMGGTCLRACYGSERLSEDLDFTGGADFERGTLSSMAQVLVSSLQEKYGLVVAVSEPVRETGNVDTWKLKVQTRPERRDMPAQRINIDICAIPSYQARPALLINPYGVEMGTSGLMMQAESREEIYANKLVAFALRPNRIKHRDLWDIAWLHQRGIAPALTLLAQKLKDHGVTAAQYLALLDERTEMLQTKPQTVSVLETEFQQEMRRFLPAQSADMAVQPAFWAFLALHMQDLAQQVRRIL